MYCSYCNAKNRDDSVYCLKCGNKLVDNPNNFAEKFLTYVKPNFSYSKSDIYEKEMKIVPDNISLTAEEIPIKQYRIAKLRSRLIAKAEGRLQVTNKRILFRASGRSFMGETKLQQEFDIGEISGVEIRKDHRFSWFNFFIGYIFINIIAMLLFTLIQILMPDNNFLKAFLSCSIGIVGLLAFIKLKIDTSEKINMLFVRAICSELSLFFFIVVFTLTREPLANEFVRYVGGFVFAICILISAVAFIISFLQYCFVPNLVIDIQTKSGQPPIQIRRKKFSLFNLSKEEFTGFYEVMPTKETDIAIKEIGTLISDIRLLGDKALNKWLK